MASLSFLFAKAIKYLHVPAIKNSVISAKAAVCPGCNIADIKMGDYSYIGGDCSVISTDIGKYCSIGRNCGIGGGSHPLDHVSTSPVFHGGRNILKTNYSNATPPMPERVCIGNDVWIGEGVYVKAGVAIGDGAVIGAHAVVTKDVPAYAIVAGCPAKVLKFRFDESIIQRLIASKWWDFDEQALRACSSVFDDPEAFLDMLEKGGAE